MAGSNPVGLNLGTLLGRPAWLGNERLWWTLALLPIAQALIYASLAFVVPRSPKYLFMRLGRREEAIRAVRWFQGADVDTGMR